MRILRSSGKFRVLLALGLLLSFGGVALAVLPAVSDDFEDGTKADAWYQVQPSPADAWLDECCGRLEFRANTPSDEEGAYYVSRKWRLQTTLDIEMEIDWHFSKTTGAFSGVLLGILADLDSTCLIAAGYDDGGAFYMAGATHNDQDEFGFRIARGVTDGTLYLSYDESEDRLYLSVNGHWQANNPSNGDWVVDGLVKGTWGVTELFVFIGGMAEGTSVAAGEGYLDDFDVVANTAVPATRQLTVQSEPTSGAGIQVTPADNNGIVGDGNGTTEFTRTYDQGCPVFLTAPETYDGRVFTRWRINGVWQAFGERQAEFELDTNTTAVAAYSGNTVPLHVLHYQYPGDDVEIQSATGCGGETNYDLMLPVGQWVVLTAPYTVTEGPDTYRFVRWWYNGYPIALQTINFLIGAETWAVAEYRAVPNFGLNVLSFGAGSVSIQSSTDHGGITNYGYLLPQNTWVVLTAPYSVSNATGDFRLVRWWFNGYPIANQTINFLMNGETWCVAEYEVIPEYSLNVVSFPQTGVNITGTHGGSTNYGGPLLEGTWVSLTAPLTDSGYVFVRWWVNGYPIASNTVNFVMTADTLVAAEYMLVPKPPAPGGRLGAPAPVRATNEVPES